MQLIAERSQELTRASGAVVEIAEGDEMVYEVTAGDATPYLGMRLKQSENLSGLCVVEGRVLRSDDTATDDRVNAELSEQANAASVVCVPLITDGSRSACSRCTPTSPATSTTTTSRCWNC